ncbi:hypothetical protein L596_025837 [Steinernema carpocapsae]|uniref:Beta-mannosidase Ig-fold domain-containing protein n=1 Tax=Steinernema carpocapsae TaxID=34508 RepID=A0A4U5M963_STECR|nr:hypothetical protein L596_025837 [Steinernema carpocapsae]
MAPVIASMSEFDHLAKTFVVSDLTTDLSNATVTLDSFVWNNGFEPVFTTRTKLDIKAFGKQVGYDGILLPDRLDSNADFGSLEISNFHQISHTEYKFTVDAEKLIPVVWIDTVDSVKYNGVIVTLSDNAFTMTAPQVTIIMTVRQNPKAVVLKHSDLKICHLGTCGLNE